jgi:hypothetical protein
MNYVFINIAHISALKKRYLILPILGVRLNDNNFFSTLQKIGKENLLLLEGSIFRPFSYTTLQHFHICLGSPFNLYLMVYHG